jgi:beta-ureidopropionase / N-carbamoyl-L-amino-acid hydrolase
MKLEKLKINAKRLRATLEESAKIGATSGGGLSRLTLTNEDKNMRDLFVKWLREIDLEVMVDEVGNIFGKKHGLDNQLAPVLTGSHLDTQPKGGRFDGILGVLGALEVMRTLHENNITTKRPLMIVDWTNEEGSRFPPAMGCSGVWSGALERDWIYSRTEANGSGKTFKEELERIGYRGSAPAKKIPLHAYFELHIEQGPMLERENKIIGIPKGILCLHWYDIYLEGTANQVGPTPMEGRNDALCAAAEMILATNKLPEKMGGNMVATVGEIQNYPNSRNIIPDKVHFTVDIRSWDDALALRAWDKLKQDCITIANSRGCPIRIEETWRVKHAEFDKKLVQHVSDVAKKLEYSTLPMVSGAGHDASYMNQIAPTAMIFVPSIGGRSHVEIESTTWEHCAAGANVLLHCLLDIANDQKFSAKKLSAIDIGTQARHDLKQFKQLQ